MLAGLNIKVSMPDWLGGLHEGFEKATAQGMPAEFGELISQYISDKAVDQGYVKFGIGGESDAEQT